MFNPLRLPDLIGNNIPPHVRAFWRVVRLIYLSTRDIMKFIWIVLFSVLEIIKAYKTPLFPYCPILGHHKSRCVRLKPRSSQVANNRTTLKILSRFDKWHCIERSYKKRSPRGLTVRTQSLGTCVRRETENSKSNVTKSREQGMYKTGNRRFPAGHQFRNEVVNGGSPNTAFFVMSFLKK